MLLPKMLLHPVDGEGRSGAAVFRQRVHDYQRGAFLGLLFSARQSAQSDRRRRGRGDIDGEDKDIRRAAALIDMGLLSKAAKVLQSAGLAPLTEDTLNQRRDPATDRLLQCEPCPMTYGSTSRIAL